MSVVRAPEIDRPGLVWFNIAQPLSLADLAGRIVILDFWTYCCINCIHVIPTLKAVEEAWPTEVVVIGVHSPKFKAEKDPANVARAIARYGIEHPIVHDPEFQLWRDYAVRAWPTMVFIGPDGRIIGQTSGEPDREALLSAVGMALEQFRSAGVVRPQSLDPVHRPEPSHRLRFPGKIKALPSGGWIVADAGHHQIVELGADGSEIRRYGSGEAGLEDGRADRARLREPQGLVADANAIFVADTGNHAIRRIDRASGRIQTLAGKGQRGRALADAPQPMAMVELASPWDLEIAGDHLYFANAGTHQLGEIDLTDGTVRRLAGDGGEDIVDGPAETCRLAQPSGLALSADRRTLYVADSETSSLRAFEIGRQHLDTIVGKGLFDFGHVNGPFDEARFQHALGVAVDGGRRLLVADSYNAEIRTVDLEAGQVEDVDGGRLQCDDPICIPLAEPAGVAVAQDGIVLVSDTNNHRIVEIDRGAGRYRTFAS